MHVDGDIVDDAVETQPCGVGFRVFCEFGECNFTHLSGWFVLVHDFHVEVVGLAMFAYSFECFVDFFLGDVASEGGAVGLSAGCVDVDLYLVDLLSVLLHSQILSNGQIDNNTRITM